MSQNIITLRSELNKQFRERHRVIDGLLTAAIAGQHVLLLGPPGTGKTKLVRQFASGCFSGGEFFNLQFSKFTKPDDVFGPVDIDAYAHKRTYRRIIEGFAWNARVCFLDEIWKASEAILQALLDMLEDRVARNDGQMQQIPLEVAVGASNEYPESEALGALYDRFALRYWVEPLCERKNLRDLILMSAFRPVVAVAYDELQDLRVNAAYVPFDAAADVLLDVKAQLAAAGITRTDRTWIAQAPALIRARAALNGHSTVQPDDFQILADMLWDRHDERQTITDIIGKVADPFGSKAIAIQDAIAGVMATLPEMAALEAGTLSKTDALSKISGVRAKVVAETDRAQDLAESAGANTQVEQTIIRCGQSLALIDELIMSVTRFRRAK